VQAPKETIPIERAMEILAREAAAGQSEKKQPAAEEP
jgi:hypothetical protein